MQQRAAAIATVQIENERVIVTEWRFPPGAETGWHCHGHDYLVVPQTSGQLLLESKDGNRSVGTEHDVVNLNPHEFVFVEIELKP